MNRRFFLSSAIALGAFTALTKLNVVAGPVFQEPKRSQDAHGAGSKSDKITKVVKTDAEWKRLLTPDQYNVMRQKGTEAPYSSPLNEIHDKGVFACAACDLALFSSAQKFDSGTGWPSFWAPVSAENVETEDDNSLFMRRTEVMCSKCDAHLGHVFEDGPKPTNLRYCVNSASLKFDKAK